MPILTSYHLHGQLHDELPQWVKRMSDALVHLTASIYNEIPFSRADAESPAEYFERLSTYFHRLKNLKAAYFQDLPEPQQLALAEELLWLDSAVDHLLQRLKSTENARTQEVLKALIEVNVGNFQQFEETLGDPPAAEQLLALMRELRNKMADVNAEITNCNESLTGQLAALSNRSLLLALRLNKLRQKKRLRSARRS